MTLALDTDALVAWTMDGAPAHRATHGLLMEELARPEAKLGLTTQVLFEFLHVVTDSRRFERPFEWSEAMARVRQLWDAKDVRRVLPEPTLVHRTLELMSTYRLGRNRILDTALAATLETAGISRLLTLNGRDFEVFSFLEIVSPT